MQQYNKVVLPKTLLIINKIISDKLSKKKKINLFMEHLVNLYHMEELLKKIEHKAKTKQSFMECFVYL